MRVTVLISTDPGWALPLAARWQQSGDTVSAILLDRACAVVRGGHRDAGRVGDALSAGVSIAVHDHALALHGIGVDRDVPLKVVDLDEIADLVADDADKVVWL